MTAPVRALLRRLSLISRLWRIPRPGYVTTIEIRQRLAVASLGLALVWCIVQPTSLAVTVLVTLGGLVLIAFLWARTMALRVTARRVLRAIAFQVGDELEELITLDNTSRLPIVWAEFIDHTNFPDYTITGVRAASGQSTLKWPVSAICTQRGIFTLGPWELRMGEPLGIFQVRQVYDQQEQFLVYPALAALPMHLRPHSKRVGDQRVLRQPLAAQTTNAISTRPYIQGDPLRHVHWRTTARQQQLFVKIFEPEASSSIWLIPDLDAATHLGAGPEASIETLVTLAASLSAQLLNERLSVGLWAKIGAAPAVLPHSGPAHLWALLSALARVQPLPNHPFSATLAQARSLVSERDSLIVITMAMDAAWLVPLQQFMRGQQRSGVEVILLDPASFGGPPGVEACSMRLTQAGMPHHVIRREDIRPISGAYGALRRWEFKTLGTGRAVARQTPRDAQTPPAPLGLTV